MSFVLIRKLIPESWILHCSKSLPLSCGAILMFHHIAPVNRKKIRYNDHLKVSPEYLDLSLARLKKGGFSFIPMDEMADLLEKRKRFSKVLSVTFDDGYRDNLTNGLPVLEHHGVPGLIYVATGLMRGESVPWWDVLEDYLLETASDFEFEGQIYAAKTMDEKCQTFLDIRKMIMFDPDQEIRRRLLAAGILPDGADAGRFSRDMLTEDDLRRYSSHRLLSFGSHTHTHAACGKLAQETFESEVRQSMEILQNCGITARHFAFPYGDDVDVWSAFAEILQKREIATAVTTYPGLVRPGSDRWFLPRIFISEYSGNTVPDEIRALKRHIICQGIKRRLRRQ